VIYQLPTNLEETEKKIEGVVGLVTPDTLARVWDEFGYPLLPHGGKERENIKNLS